MTRLTEIKSQYETSDGLRWTDKEEATRHQQLLDLNGEYNHARERLNAHTARMQKTADDQDKQAAKEALTEAALAYVESVKKHYRALGVIENV